MNFVGTVINKKIHIDMRQTFDRYVSLLDGKRVVVEVKKFRKNRSDAQNRFWWGVCIDILSKHCGYTPEEMHDAIKYKFLPIEKNGLKSCKSTTSLTTEEFNNLIGRVQMWAAEELSLYIPDPNEEERGL